MHSQKSWAQMDFSVFSNFSALFDNNRIKDVRTSQGVESS